MDGLSRVRAATPATDDDPFYSTSDWKRDMSVETVYTRLAV
jgi:hypothetical protein